MLKIYWILILRKKTHDVIVADTFVSKDNPDAIVVTKKKILDHRKM